MLRLAATLLGLTLTTLGPAQAQQQERLVFQNSMECLETEFLENYVRNEFAEIPFTESKIFLQSSKNGRLYEGTLVLYINPETKTYSLIVGFDDGISCMLGSGVDFAPAKIEPTV
jgi:hypothetical protein